jgi:arginine decarboxylase
MIPTRLFFTKGVGTHRDRLASFEQALRVAGIEKYNLVHVSSIMPPGCRILTKKQGIEKLKPGQILHVVMARIDTNEPNRMIASAIGMARPADTKGYGYLSEHHAYGQNAKVAGDYAEDLAATMLATTLGIDFDPGTAWDQRKQIYRASGKIIKTTNVCQSAKGNKDGLWTTTLAAAVLIVD